MRDRKNKGKERRREEEGKERRKEEGNSLEKACFTSFYLSNDF